MMAQGNLKKLSRARRVMENFLEIIKGRQSPGILVFDFNNRLLYSNQEILALLPVPPALGSQKNDRQVAIPPDVFQLCEMVKQAHAAGCAPQSEKIAKTCALLGDGTERLVSLRAFVIQGHGSSSDRSHIMVLVEKVVESHSRDFEKIRQAFNFSSRELEVLRQVCTGLSNRAIAGKLFISEHTVKDHIKHIMQKMQVSSRSEILASLKP